MAASIVSSRRDAGLGGLGVADRERLAERVLDQAPLAVGALQRACRRRTRGRSGRCRRCRPSRAAGWPGTGAGRCAGAPAVSLDAGQLELLHRRALAGGHRAREVGEAGCRAWRACAGACRASTPSSGASLAAVLAGSLTRYGVAETSSAGSETASSKPWRSTIVPRRAGSSSELTCWLAAALARLEPLTVPRKSGAPGGEEQEREERGEEEADAALEQRHRLALAALGSACAARDGGAGPSRSARCVCGAVRRCAVVAGAVVVVRRRGGGRRRRGGGVAGAAFAVAARRCGRGGARRSPRCAAAARSCVAAGVVVGGGRRRRRRRARRRSPAWAA